MDLELWTKLLAQVVVEVSLGSSASSFVFEPAMTKSETSVFCHTKELAEWVSSGMDLDVRRTLRPAPQWEPWGDLEPNQSVETMLGTSSEATSSSSSSQYS